MRTPKKKGYDPIADQIGRWNLQTRSRKLLKCVDRVMRMMTVGAVYELRTPKFQVAVTPQGMIWAYFPIHKRRQVVRQLPNTLPETRVLLTIPESKIERQSEKTTCADLAHHFGHVLCYLRKPGWKHECLDADRAARKCGLKQMLQSPKQLSMALLKKVQQHIREESRQCAQ